MHLAATFGTVGAGVGTMSSWNPGPTVWSLEAQIWRHGGDTEMSNKWFGWMIAGSALLVATAIVVLPAMGSPPPPLPPVDILHDEAFGPVNYMSGRSMMPD